MIQWLQKFFEDLAEGREWRRARDNGISTWQAKLDQENTRLFIFKEQYRVIGKIAEKLARKSAYREILDEGTL